MILLMNIGVDLVLISEFQKRLESSGGVGKVFLDSELGQNVRVESLAGIFAAKEAFFKAMGRKIDWREVWIEKDKEGKPLLQSSLLPSSTRAEVSVSHSGDYAIAVVLLKKINGDAS